MSRLPMPMAACSVPRIAEILATGDAMASDIAWDTLRWIAGCGDPTIFTRLTLGRARGEAAAVDSRIAARLPLRPLDGVPVAWKDLFDLAGEVTRVRSVVLDDGPAKVDAELVQQLTGAGAVTVGLTNMSAFAFSGLGLNPHYGTPSNPWSKTHN